MSDRDEANTNTQAETNRENRARNRSLQRDLERTRRETGEVEETEQEDGEDTELLSRTLTALLAPSFSPTLPTSSSLPIPSLRDEGNPGSTAPPPVQTATMAAPTQPPLNSNLNDRFSLTPFNGTGWKSWSRKAEMILDYHEVWDITQGTETPPGPDNLVAARDYKQRSKKALVLLVGCLQGDAEHNTRDYSTAAEIWAALKKRYETITEEAIERTKDAWENASFPLGGDGITWSEHLTRLATNLADVGHPVTEELRAPFPPRPPGGCRSGVRGQCRDRTRRPRDLPGERQRHRRTHARTVIGEP